MLISCAGLEVTSWEATVLADLPNHDATQTLPGSVPCLLLQQDKKESAAEFDLILVNRLGGNFWPTVYSWGVGMDMFELAVQTDSNLARFFS